MFSSLFKRLSEEDKNLKATLKGLLGKPPKNLEIYKLALRHASISSKESNERLEFLGDAILGSIVAEFLFKKFPFKDEGFLTEIRSRIVKRDSLNSLALKLGLKGLIEASITKGKTNYKSIYGNALEALVGAVYIDKGYEFTYQFVITRIITPLLDLKEVVEKNFNFKSILIEWAQKNNKDIKFHIVSEEGENHSKKFTSKVTVEGVNKGTGIGLSKKRAEQSAAEQACKSLNLK